MLKIELTQGKYVLIDKEDFVFLNKYNWHVTRTGYAARSSNIEKGKQSTVLMHRIIINAPKGKQVDHINGDRLDCRKKNLRVCTRHENQMNKLRHKDSNSPFKGISKTKSSINPKWESHITLRGKIIYLGTFEKAEEAALAYNKKAVELFGNFASLNKIYA